jgi:hypothetical protein
MSGLSYVKLDTPWAHSQTVREARTLARSRRRTTGYDSSSSTPNK